MMNSETPENYAQADKNFQNANTDAKSSDPHSNPYDSENLDNESDSESKDITEKDIEEDLIHNDPSEGFETQIDIQKSNEAESDRFQTIEPDQDNPVHKEFEIGQLGSETLKKMNSQGMRRVILDSTIINLLSENFNVLRFDACKKTVIINGFFIGSWN